MAGFTRVAAVLAILGSSVALNFSGCSAGAADEPAVRAFLDAHRPENEALYTEPSDVPLEMQRVAIVSSATPAFLASGDESATAAEHGIFSKQCYCHLRSSRCTFVHDATDYAARHGRTGHWNRIPAVRRLLPFYDWVMYLDADIIITSAAPNVRQFIRAAQEASGDTFLILQDGMELNSGGFVLRGGSDEASKSSELFLDAWWAIGNLEWDLENNRRMYDQGALHTLVLLYTHLYAPDRDWAGTCERPPGRSAMSFAACWWRAMGDLSMPLGRRSTRYIYFWDSEQHSDLRGFNLMNAVGNEIMAYEYHPSVLWQKGDFAVHQIDLKRFPGLYSVFWSEGVTFGDTCPGRQWTITPSCHDEPCIESLWSPKGKFLWDSRWRDYKIQPEVSGDRVTFYTVRVRQEPDIDSSRYLVAGDDYRSRARDFLDEYDLSSFDEESVSGLAALFSQSVAAQMRELEPEL